MVRSILSVVVGYIVMAILIAISFVPVFAAPGLVFQDDSADASLAFSLYSLLTSGIAAFVGGFVAAWVAPRGSRMPLRVFAGLVLALGLASALAGLRAEKPTVTAEEISHMTMMERASHGKEPTRYAFLLPFIGGAGVLAGGAVRNKLRKPTTVE